MLTPYRLAAVLLSGLVGLLTACPGDDGPGPEDGFPTPVIEGFGPKHQVAYVGDTITWELRVTFPGGKPAWVGVRTMYDMPQAPDPWAQVVYDGDRIQVQLTVHEEGLVISNGTLDLYEIGGYNATTFPIPTTASVTVLPRIDPSRVTFPVTEAALVVGEVRPLQAAPVADVAGEPFERDLGTPLTYRSTDEAVFTVDASGVVTAVGPGEAELRAEAGVGLDEAIMIRVTEGPLAAPQEGAYRVSPFAWYPDDLDLPGGQVRPVDSLAVDAEGRPWFLMQQFRRPLYLVGWTGSGFGYERLGEWHEQKQRYFLGIGGDDRLYLGWQSHQWPGVAVLDRPLDTVVGGWQRRLLPITPYPDQDPVDTIAAHGVGLQVELHHPLRVSVLPSLDGLWVLYVYGGRLDVWGYDTPEALFCACARTIRLAHLTGDALAVEEVERARYKPGAQVFDPDYLCNLDGDCGDYCFDFGPPSVNAIWATDLSPPEPGTGDRPLVLVAENDQSLWDDLSFALAYQDGQWGVESQAMANGTVLALTNPYLDQPARRTPASDPDLAAEGGGTGRNWGTPVADGSYLVGGGVSSALVRVGPYASAEEGPQRRRDELMDLWHGPGVVVGGPPWLGTAANATHVFVLSSQTPPTAENPDDPDDAWLYVARVPLLARHDDDEHQGQRLFADRSTVDGRRVLALSGGERVLLADGNVGGYGAQVGRSSGPGVPLTLIGQPSGLEELSHDWVTWADGPAVYVARSGAWNTEPPRPIRVFRSDDAGASFSLVGELPSTDLVHAGVGLGGGRHLVTVDGSAAGSFGVWRLEESGGSLDSSPVDDGSDGAFVMAYGQGADLAGLAVLGSEATLVMQLGDFAGHFRLVTRRYAADGTRLSSQSVTVASGDYLPRLLALTGGGQLLVGRLSGPSGFETLDVSTDQGATWAPIGLDLSALPAGGLRQLRLARLADGRVALAARFHHPPNDQVVEWAATTDGTTWTALERARPLGGHAQAIRDLAAEPDGGLLILMDDSGTFSGAASSTDTLVIRVEP